MLPFGETIPQCPECVSARFLCGHPRKGFFYWTVFLLCACGLFFGAAIWVADHYHMMRLFNAMHSVPFVLLCVAHLAFFGMDHREVDPSYAYQYRNCDRAMARVGVAFACCIFICACVFYINMDVWWETPPEFTDAQTPPHPHARHTESPTRAPSPSPDSHVPSWLVSASRTPTPTPTPSFTPSPSVDPKIAARRAQVIDNAKSTVGAFFMASAVFGIISVWTHYQHKATPPEDATF